MPPLCPPAIWPTFESPRGDDNLLVES